MHKIYLYIPFLNEDTKEEMINIIDCVSYKEIDTNFFSFILKDKYYIEFIKALESDLYIDVSLMYLNIELNSDIENIILKFLKVNKGMHTISSLITNLVLEEDFNSINIIKDFYKNRLTSEIINTGLKYIEIGNSLKASQELYLHRNTLNYRLDTIYKNCSMDLKEFKDKLSFYILYK